MKYGIKSRPTKYAGSSFRSRLEATWAAFFDLCGWQWTYEPIDLDGWVPDFMLTFDRHIEPIISVLVEVKPVSTDESRFDKEFDKARVFWDKYHILCLGICPGYMPDYLTPGGLMDCPIDAKIEWDDLRELLCVEDAKTKWRNAQALTQWHPR